MKENHILIRRERLFRYTSRFNNIIIGDLNTSEILICAHYDLYFNCYLNKFVSMKNNNRTFIIINSLNSLLLIILYSLFMLLFFMVITPNLWLIAILVILLFFPMNNLNPVGYNDNSSGIDIALRFANNDKVAIVLFDLEEFGYWGSKRFVKKTEKS